MLPLSLRRSANLRSQMDGGQSPAANESVGQLPSGLDGDAVNGCLWENDNVLAWIVGRSTSSRNFDVDLSTSALPAVAHRCQRP